MNTGTGKLVEIEAKKAKELERIIGNSIRAGTTTLKGTGIFKTGELVEVKGSTFMVTNITAHKLTLRIITH